MTPKKEIVGEEPKKKLEDLGGRTLKQIEGMQNPDIPLPIRTLSNIFFDEKTKIIKLGDKLSHRTYLNIAHTRKFMQTLLIAAECKKIIQQGVTTSIRDLYYAIKHTIPGTQENTVEEQAESDPILEDLEAALNTLRESLHLQADRKGYVAGPLVVDDIGDTIDCMKMGSSGWAIPSNVEAEVIKFKECGADFVLCMPPYEMLFVLVDGKPKLMTISDIYELQQSVVEAVSFGNDLKLSKSKIKTVSRRQSKPGEKLVRITTRSGAEIEVTKDHKIPVLTEAGIEYKGAKEVTPDMFLIEAKAVPLELLNSRSINLIEILSKLGTRGARISGCSTLIGKGTAQQLGLSITKTVDGKTYTYPYNYLVSGWKERDSIPLEHYKKLAKGGEEKHAKIFFEGAKKKNAVNAIVGIDVKFARLLGYYLAEGHIHRNSVGFSFGKHENDYIVEVESLISDIFGIKPVKYSHGGETQIFAQNKAVALFFRFIDIGTGSDSKRIPDFVYSMPEEFKKNLLETYINGDGYDDRDVLKTATVSRELNLGINMLCRMIGIPTYQRHIKNRGFGSGNELFSVDIPKKYWNKEIAKSHHLWERYPFFLVGGKRKRRFATYYCLGHKTINRSLLESASCEEAEKWLGSDVHPVMVRKVETIDYEGPLYDLVAVEPNHIYMHGSGVFVHNCIEKDAVWQRLNEDKFWKKHNCLILTGKGQPARGTRRLINRLHTELKLPIYVLTDADPWGYYIYSVIKQGSINLSFLSDRLGTPEAKFIGLTTQDVKTFSIPQNVTIKLNKGDVKRTQEMMEYVWFKPKEWQHELKHMIDAGVKLELEALSAKGIRFISEKYLPEKIKNKDFLP